MPINTSVKMKRSPWWRNSRSLSSRASTIGGKNIIVTITEDDADLFRSLRNRAELAIRTEAVAHGESESLKAEIKKTAAKCLFASTNEDMHGKKKAKKSAEKIIRL